MTDPITDFLNRIRNAQGAQKAEVVFPFSKLKYEIAKILEKRGLVEKVEKKERKTRKVIELTLKYEDKLPLISGLKRVSKPGQRIYQGYRDIKQIKSGFGFSIISTPQGLMTDKEAKRKKLGGEIICQIW